MSQSRARRALSGAREASARAAAPVTKAPADSGPGKPRQNHRSKSRNKIPKSIRYDLENALLGLCDVWFEEIKPHLIRNNIKLHVDTLEAEDSGESDAAGDHRRSTCAHLDPGAAFDRRRRPAAGCAGCCPMRPTASRVPCRKPPTQPSQPCATPPLSSRLIPNSKQNYGSQGSATRRQLPRREPRAPPSPASLVLPSTALVQSRHNQQKANNSTKQARNYIKNRKRRSKKQTRTESPPPPSPPPASWRVPRLCRTLTALPVAAEPCARTRLAHPPSPRHSVNKDLINLIGEKHDKRLELLYKNPNRENSYSSIMNLAPSSQHRKKDADAAVTKMPWR